MVHYITAALTAATTQPTAPASLVGYILQYGLIGLLLLDVTLTHRLFVPRWVVDQISKEHARQRDEMQTRIDTQTEVISSLTDHLMGEVVPALTRATDISKDYVDMLRERGHEHR